MPSTYTTSLRLELQSDGENNLTWGQKTNQNLQLVEQAISGWTSVSVAGSSDVTLTTAQGSSDQARNMFVQLSGALGGNINIIVPTVSKGYVFDNATTGTSGGVPYTITVKTSSGTGVLLRQGYKTHVYCDGTNVVQGPSYFPTLVAASASFDNLTFTGASIDGGTYVFNNPVTLSRYHDFFSVPKKGFLG